MIGPLSFAVLALAISSLPQESEAPETLSSPWFGSRASFAGDVDGDGREDLIVMDGHVGVGGLAWVLSGHGRRVLHRFPAERDGRPLYRLLGAGDVDMDGHADLVVAWARTGDRWKGGSPHEVRSGKNGELLRTFQASSASRTVDFDGDGRRDWLVRHFDLKDGHEDFGTHRIVSTAGDEVLWETPASQGEGGLGWSSVVVGDVDGDGLPDIAGAKRHGAVHELVVLTVRTEAPLLRVRVGRDISDSFTLCDAGDLDGDGHDDIAVGRMVNSGPDREAFLVYSGADGSVLLEVDEVAIGYGAQGVPREDSWDADFGSGVARTVDLDGDGVRDFLGGAESFSLGAGAFVLVSARGGAVLHVEEAPSKGDHLGCVHFASGLDAGADWDGDGTEDWLVTSGSITGGPGIGEVRIYSGATRGLWTRSRAPRSPSSAGPRSAVRPSPPREPRCRRPRGSPPPADRLRRAASSRPAPPRA